METNGNPRQRLRPWRQWAQSTMKVCCGCGRDSHVSTAAPTLRGEGALPTQIEYLDYSCHTAEGKKTQRLSSTTRTERPPKTTTLQKCAARAAQLPGNASSAAHPMPLRPPLFSILIGPRSPPRADWLLAATCSSLIGCSRAQAPPPTSRLSLLRVRDVPSSSVL